MYVMLIEILASAVVLIPIFLLLWKVKFHEFRKTLFYTVFAIYLSAVYFFVGLPTIQFMEFDVTLNLIPFVGMISDFKNAVLNIILFAPLGIMLPVLWEKYRVMKHTLLFGIGMTLAIELLQLLTFRATDINDIITNTMGTVLGYSIFRIVAKKIPVIYEANNKKDDIYFVFIVVFAVMFFVQPFVVSLIYSLT